MKWLSGLFGGKPAASNLTRVSVEIRMRASTGESDVMHCPKCGGSRFYPEQAGLSHDSQVTCAGCGFRATCRTLAEHEAMKAVMREMGIR